MAPEPPRELLRPDANRFREAEAYDPGRFDRLRGAERELSACLAKSGMDFGALVIELAFDASGLPTSTKVHGLLGDEVRACVASVAQHRARRPVGAASSGSIERCSLAYGVAPMTALTGIDVTPTEIRYHGKLFDSVAIEAGWRLPQLFDELRASVAEKNAANRPVLSIDGPFVIRVEAAVPMGVANRVLSTTLHAGENFVLAAKRGAVWEPLVPIAIPVVPVPIGTGGAWMPVAISGAQNGPAQPAVALLVTKADVWLHGVGGAAPVVIARDAELPAKLAAALKTLPKGHLQIGGSDDALYGDFVSALDAVVAAGFTDWQLAEVQRTP